MVVGGLVTKSCPALCDPMDCSPPGSSVLGILQVRTLEWVAISFTRRIVWRFLIKLKLEVLNDPAVPLLGIYLEENMIQKDTC